MKVMKQLAVIAMMCLSATMVAAPVSVKQARKVANGFLKSEASLHQGARKAPRKVQAAPRQLMDDQQFYVFETESGGFVIIAADDCAHPILAYGEKSPWSSDAHAKKMPLNLKQWLEGYNYSIRKAAADGYQAPAAVRAEWAAFAAGDADQATPVVEPLIKTHWDQNQEYINVQNTYNYYTPSDVYYYEGEPYPMNCPVGCVATAMAQVMKYWEWPTRGTGSHSYTPETNPQYGVQSANFGATTYDWANMPDQLTYDGSTNTQIRAVAKLMYHCGVACNMDYTINGSSAYTAIIWKTQGYYPAEHALCTYFGYSNTMQIYKKDDFESDENWVQMLKDELNAGRPMMYGGQGAESGGHSFVCCGYDSEDRFYFNFGWGGAGDGYFELDAIMPETGGSGSNSEHNYSFGQDAIIGIRPAETAAESTYDYALRMYTEAGYEPMLDKDSLRLWGDTLNINFTIANYDTLDYNGYIALQIVDTNGRVAATTEPEAVYIGYYETYDCFMEVPAEFAMTPGVYHVQPVYMTSGGSWVPIESYEYWSRLQFVVYDFWSLYAYSEMDILPNPLVQGFLGSVSIDIANVTGMTLDGIFYAALYDAEGNWVQDIGEVDLSSDPIQSGYYYPYTFTDTITAAPGEYILCVNYWNGEGAYIIGSNLYPAARAITVISPSDIPADQLVYDLKLDYMVQCNEQYSTEIHAGDSIWGYIYVSNKGLADFNGYLSLALYDDTLGYVMGTYRYITLSAINHVNGFLFLDTTLAAGNYYLYLSYYDPAEQQWYDFTYEDEEEGYNLIAFTVLPAEGTGVETVKSAARKPRKIMQNGMVIVERPNGNRYSLTGLKVED